MLPAIVDREMRINNEIYKVRVTFSYGDYICFIKKYDYELNLIEPVKLIHFGHRNTLFREYYFWMKQFSADEAEIIRLIVYRVFGEGNWSNNDRKRVGKRAIQVKGS